MDIEDEHKRHLIAMRGMLQGLGYFVALDALELIRLLESGFRKDGKTPRFDHQLSIARILCTLLPHLLYPEEVIACCFLHDLLEDHPEWTFELLEARFGRRIANAVWALSKKSNGMVKTPERYYGDLANCPIASLVKVGDRIHNQLTMKGVFTPEKQQAYLKETEEHIFPMIRTARRQFPKQFPAYENLKYFLRVEEALLKE